MKRDASIVERPPITNMLTSGLSRKTHEKNDNVVILCGGKGTRLHPLTRNIPKPLIKIGDMPITEHIIRIFGYYGYKNFFLLTGYKGHMVRDYFRKHPLDLNIKCIDTGIDSDTAERIWRVRNMVSDVFLLCYSDVLADINIDEQMAFHRSHGKVGTIAVTPLSTSYGIVKFDEKNIAFDYLEKPTIRDYWINAGFFVFNTTLFDHWEWTDADFSRGMLPKLSKARLLGCYKHGGFWSTMDTVREHEILNEIWNRGKAKWAIWKI